MNIYKCNIQSIQNPEYLKMFGNQFLRAVISKTVTPSNFSQEHFVLLAIDLKQRKIWQVEIQSGKNTVEF